MNEPENRYDCYAVAVKSKLPGFLTDIIVGHVPIELSRYLFYAQEHGCAFTVRVKSSHYILAIAFDPGWAGNPCYCEVSVGQQ